MSIDAPRPLPELFGLQPWYEQYHLVIDNTPDEQVIASVRPELAQSGKLPTITHSRHEQLLRSQGIGIALQELFEDIDAYRTNDFTFVPGNDDGSVEYQAKEAEYLMRQRRIASALHVTLQGVVSADQTVTDPGRRANRMAGALQRRIRTFLVIPEEHRSRAAHVTVRGYYWGGRFRSTEEAQESH